MAQKRAAVDKNTAEIPAIPPLRELSILTLDLGLRTGWALRPAGEPISSGVFQLFDPAEKVRRFKDGARFAALRRFVHGVNESVGGLGLLAFEDVAPQIFRSARQAQLYPGFRAAVMEWAHTHDVPVIPIAVGTWKAAFVGKGNATKQEVISECVRRGHLPFDDPDLPPAKVDGLTDDNEADALGLLYALPVISLAQKASELSKNAPRVRDKKISGMSSTKPRRRRANAKSPTAAEPTPA